MNNNNRLIHTAYVVQAQNRGKGASRNIDYFDFFKQITTVLKWVGFATHSLCRNLFLLKETGLFC